MFTTHAPFATVVQARTAFQRDPRSADALFWTSPAVAGGQSAPVSYHVLWHRVRLAGAKTRAAVADEYHNRPDKAANILVPVEVQCDWLRACGFGDVDCYFKAFELAVFGGRRP